MNYKNKSILISIIALVLIFSFLFWFFVLRTSINSAPAIQLTNQQEIDVLSATSDIPAQIVTDEEKQIILNKTDPNIKPTNNLSQSEILQILNKTK